MARSKPKPAKVKKPSRRGAKKAAAGEFEVEAADEADKAPISLEAGLVMVTFVALLAAFVLIQVQMSSAFGAGLFG